MSHLKGLLIDGERLVLGSSNFDFASLAAEEEFIAVVTDATIIADFENRVIAPTLSDTQQDEVSVGGVRGLAAHVALRLAAVIAGGARGSRRRAVDWPGKSNLIAPSP